MKRIKVSKKAAKILDWIFTVLYIGFAFWADWRIGLAFIAYELSCMFSDMKAEMRVNRVLDDLITHEKYRQENRERE